MPDAEVVDVAQAQRKWWWTFNNLFRHACYDPAVFPSTSAAECTVSIVSIIIISSALFTSGYVF